MAGITIVIPANNEESIIGSVVLTAKKNADRVIVIDYTSHDRTAEIAEAAGAEVIQLPNRKGKKLCIKEGIEEAAKNSDIIVTMNILKCHDPCRIKTMVEPLKNGEYDLVLGTCFYNRPEDYDDDIGTSDRTKDDEKVAFIACLRHCLDKIELKDIYTRSPDEITSLAKENGIRANYMDLEQDNKFGMFKDFNIGVVIPAYNEELLIEETVNGIPSYIDRIYLIDDCSTDRTPEIIKQMSDPRIVSLRHEINKGVGASIIDGYKMALEDQMDVVTVMGGDNQMDPDQIPRLIVPIIKGQADYTKGNRLIGTRLRKGMSKWRMFGNFILSMLTKIGSGYWRIMDPQNGYCAISNKALRTIDLDSIYPYYGYCNDMLIKLNAYNMRVKDILIPSRYGSEKSSISYGKYMLKVSPMLFRGFLWRMRKKYMMNDFHPLVLFYLASMILIPSGLFFGAWIIFQKILQNPVSPNFPLLDALIILMGTQFLLFAMLFDMQAERRT